MKKPLPSLSDHIQLITTLLMLCTSDVYTLINYVGFINTLFYGVTVAGQIVLRFKQPDKDRPIKVKTDSEIDHCIKKMQHFPLCTYIHHCHTYRVSCPRAFFFIIY